MAYNIVESMAYYNAEWMASNVVESMAYNISESMG